jgi:hypothetical protein
MRMLMKLATERFAFRFFWASTLLLVFCAGVVVGRYRVFPFQVFSLSKKGYDKLAILNWRKCSDYQFMKAKNARPEVVYTTPQACEGLNLVTRMTPEGAIVANVMDMDGKNLHQWSLDWFKIWPDAKHLPKNLVPQDEPGTMIHGAVLLENGNLVFNFDYLGLVCLDFQGNVVWRLPYMTHHSVTRADDGNLWVCGQIYRKTPKEQIPNLQLPFREDMLLEVTPEGKIKHEWSIVDLLLKNGKEGLLYMRGKNVRKPILTAGAFHLNDVEPFPARLKEGFFKKGDVLVSLRNVNTVFVFNRNDDKIKYLRTGSFVWQHDPDFVDGETISVFDNHPVDRSESRILLISAPSQKVTVFYEGTAEHPFYSDVMGKQQWLPNGNLLITESRHGRAFEIDRKGKIVWEYNNYVDKERVGLVTQATRLPPSYALLFGNSRLNSQASRSLELQEKVSIAEKSNGEIQR